MNLKNDSFLCVEKFTILYLTMREKIRLRTEVIFKTTTIINTAVSDK